jgi:hypothetical protein
MSPEGFPRPDRRRFLRVGGVTLAAAAWEAFGRPAARAAAAPAAADAVLLLWLPGGVTHHESFDPKPDAPAEVRGDIQPIETNVPGVRFAEVLPQLARHMDKLALVRSFAAGTADHFEAQAYALSGRNRLPGGILSEPNVGCFVARQLGAAGGLPGYVAVPGTTRPGPPNTNLFVPAWLGARHAPFATGGEPRNPQFRVEGLAPAGDVPDDRFGRRQGLRERLEAGLRAAERGRAEEELDELYGGAVRLLTSPEVRAAFDVRAEPAAVREKYGMSKVGQRCLLARRLIDAGARFVMMDYGYDWGEYDNLWDNHCVPTQHQPPITRMVKEPYHLPAVDRAFAALLDDLAQTGRLARTLVVYLTEFGRTPKFNQYGGRDHWADAGSIFFAGGGVRGGQVVGGTDKVGGYCTARPYSPADAAATVYRAVGIDPATTVPDREGRPVPIQPAGEPIPVF